MREKRASCIAFVAGPRGAARPWVVVEEGTLVDAEIAN
jgi:hypothetical protein